MWIIRRIHIFYKKKNKLDLHESQGEASCWQYYLIIDPSKPIFALTSPHCYSFAALFGFVGAHPIRHCDADDLALEVFQTG